MKTAEMKQILFEKLQAENCYFSKSDISIRKDGNGYKIIIADYEHIIFTIKLETDSEFNNAEEMTLWTQHKDSKHKNLLMLEESHSDKTMKDILIYLGYYIGTRF